MTQYSEIRVVAAISSSTSFCIVNIFITSAVGKPQSKYYIVKSSIFTASNSAKPDTEIH